MNIKLIELKPNCNVKEILTESFKNIDKAKLLLKNYEFSKKVFKCCYNLKEKPTREFYKSISKDSIVFLGIKKEDNKNRRIWLLRLEKKNTFIHYNKNKRIFIGYPLRDISNETIVDFINKSNFKVFHSGCVICPILLLFNNKKDLKRYVYSKKFFLKINGFQSCIDFDNGLNFISRKVNNNQISWK
jgi:3'-phosphoadenosine 5'-phosphosulfate sulfotransferase (PAPS reductase)/FAD synthetase